MFVVKQILKHGYFRDQVLIVASEDAVLTRKRLGWDHFQAPDLKVDTLEVSKGQEFLISFARKSVNQGQSISPGDVGKMSAFNRLWKRSY